MHLNNTYLIMQSSERGHFQFKNYHIVNMQTNCRLYTALTGKYGRMYVSRR